MFQPDVGQELNIDGRVLSIDPHPAAPKIPFGQEGKQAIVFKVSSNTKESLALKVFKPRYRRPFLVTITERMAKYADLPGMKVCDREVISPQTHIDILKEHPDLAYAAVMPWIEGPTWSEVLLSRRVLSPEESLSLARSLLKILISLEEKGLSHGDLSGVNIMIPYFAGGQGISLVDVEQLYIPGMEKPDVLPDGSPGYGFPGGESPPWGPFTDRFPGSIILAEMLCFCDKEVVKASWGESYFSPEELGQDTPLFRLMEETLTERYGDKIASIFRRNWYAQSLEDCSTFAEWFIYLPEEARVKEDERRDIRKRAPVTPGAKIPKKKWDLEGLLHRAQELASKDDKRGAIELYQYILTTYTLPEDFREHITSEVERYKSAIQAEKEKVPEKEAKEEEEAGAYPYVYKPAEKERAEEEAQPAEVLKVEPSVEVKLKQKRNNKKMILAGSIIITILVIAALSVLFIGGGGEEVLVVEIPELLGLTLEEAEARLAESGLTIGEIDSQETTESEPGVVLSTDPSSGSFAEEGSAVNLVLSAEPGQITIPDLSGKDQASAQSELEALGLAVSIAHENSDTIMSGCCTRTDPGAGAGVDPGTTVQLFISLGPQQQPEQETSSICPTCGGSGSITCTACGGAGGTYTTTTTTCPTCGGNGWVTCSKCGGTGFLPGNITCDLCGGRGTTVCSTCGGSGQATTRVFNPCSRCGGSGRLTCPTCGGTGRISAYIRDILGDFIADLADSAIYHEHR